jgi:hypothetical protein
MGFKANVPLGVAIEGIKLAKRRVFSPIAPRVSAVLKVDPMQLARLKDGSNAVYIKGTTRNRLPI